MMDARPFWKTRTLEAMSDAEWESLCDGCGRCCLVKLEEEADPDTDVAPPRAMPRHARAKNPALVPPGADNPRTWYTDLGCRLLDGDTCRCSDYANRQAKVPDCVKLTPQTVRTLGWLPPTCAYRLVAEGRDLYWWHPLVSGDPETVHAAGVSVRGRVAASEDDLPLYDYEDRIVGWPLHVPKRARAR
jgi:uncharacterized cysteine cluster protein YcgN (CxxCxxCC family)